MKSANVSPTVVHSTLMIQKYSVTSGTLLSRSRISADGCNIEDEGRVITNLSRSGSLSMHEPDL